MQEPTFEEALNRLEEIIAELEDGDAGLEAMLALFEEGAELIKRCQGRLEQAEARIVDLSRKMEQGETHE